MILPFMSQFVLTTEELLDELLYSESAWRNEHLYKLRLCFAFIF